MIIALRQYFFFERPSSVVKQIHPGFSVKGETILDVSKGSDATLQVTDGGWTTELVNIFLRKIQ